MVLVRASDSDLPLYSQSHPLMSAFAHRRAVSRRAIVSIPFLLSHTVWLVVPPTAVSCLLWASTV